jgi:hypothetical protein
MEHAWCAQKEIAPQRVVFNEGLKKRVMAAV